jgi:hypothetical protein
MRSSRHLRSVMSGNRVRSRRYTKAASKAGRSREGAGKEQGREARCVCVRARVCACARRPRGEAVLAFGVWQHWGEALIVWSSPQGDPPPKVWQCHGIYANPSSARSEQHNQGE